MKGFSSISLIRCASYLLTVTLLVASTADGQAPARDSAGVRITTIALLPPTGVLRMSAEPVVDIGGTTGDPANELNQVRGAVRLRDGTVVVANNSPPQLRFFDAHGKFVRSAGRKGGGPGEFTSLTTTWAVGDTILVYDAQARRIVLFSKNGDVVATHPLVEIPGRSQSVVLAALGDRSLVGGSSDVLTTPARPTPYYFTQHLFQYDLLGAPHQDIGTFNDGEHFVQQIPARLGGTGYWNLAYGRQTTVAARGNNLLIGDGTTFELRTYNKTGALLEILRAPSAQERLSDAEKALYRKAELTGVKPADLEIEEKRLGEMPYPAMMPAFKRFLVGEDGRIWVQRYPHVTDTRERWVVLDARGQFLDELTMPERFTLWHAGAGYTLGLYRDDDDVEHVREYSVSALAARK